MGATLENDQHSKDPSPECPHQLSTSAAEVCIRQEPLANAKCSYKTGANPPSKSCMHPPAADSSRYSRRTFRMFLPASTDIGPTPREDAFNRRLQLHRSAALQHALIYRPMIACTSPALTPQTSSSSRSGQSVCRACVTQPFPLGSWIARVRSRPLHWRRRGICAGAARRALPASSADRPSCQA